MVFLLAVACVWAACTSNDLKGDLACALGGGLVVLILGVLL